MDKKLIITTLIFFTLLYCGCEISNLNNYKNTVKLATSDIKQLIGVTYDDIDKIYGAPEKSTYYVNKSDLSSLQGNYITLRDFNHHFIIKAYYNTGDKDAYIVLWYKNNKVIEALFNETDIISKDSFCSEVNNTDFKIDYFSSSSHLRNKYNLEEYKTYIGDNIYSFNKKYNLSCPKIAVNFLNSNKILYFYYIDKSKNEYEDDYLFIVSNNNKITYINTVNSSKICETILEYMKKDIG